MAKRTFRKRKPTFRKKRFTRKRRFNRKQPLPMYDGMIRVKIQATKELNNTDGSGVTTFDVLWGDQVNAASANVLRIADSLEFPKYKNIYR